jgi:hypothetical protein
MEGAKVPKWKLFYKVLEGSKMKGFQNDTFQNGSVARVDTQFSVVTI